MKSNSAAVEITYIAVIAAVVLLGLIIRDCLLLSL